MATESAIGAATLLPLGELNTPLRARLRDPGQAQAPSRTVEDTVTLSPEARDAAALRQPAAAAPAAAGDELSDQERAALAALKRRDAQVRRHERAHQTAGGGLVGPARFEFQRGPDGKSYAVGGEVSIDSSPAPTPEATIDKMAAVIRAALAPVDPSTTDRQVAAQARQTQAEARGELAQEREQEAARAEADKAQREERLGLSESGSAEASRAAAAYARTEDAVQAAFAAAGFSLNA